MDRRTDWDDADLLAALNRYQAELIEQAYSPSTIDSYVYYGRLFLRWRTGDYVPCDMPLPAERPVPAGTPDLAGLGREFGRYETFLRSTCLQPGAISTYLRDAGRFVRWLGGSQVRRAGARHPPAHSAARRTTVIPAPPAVSLTSEFARIRENHRKAILRTVARAALPGSVGRVFMPGTKSALVDLLPNLPVDRLREFSEQTHYREWFEAALEPVSNTILGLNPPGPRSGIHPGYKWGHGTKVLSLFVRDLVLFSRYFIDDEARRLERWLYCPVDGIVIDRLRRVGFDPGVTLIREIEEASFWRIQDSLSEAAATTGVPPVWFDDVWSETRD